MNVRLLLVLSLLGVSMETHAQGEQPAPPGGPRVLVPGMKGNAPAAARKAASDAAADALASTVPVLVMGCKQAGGPLMGLGIEVDECTSGRLSLDDALQLDVTHLVTGEVMLVDRTYYVTLVLRSRTRVEGTGSGSASTPDGAARDAWNALKPDVQRVFKLAPPPAPRPKKVPPTHILVSTLRTGNLPRFDLQPAAIRGAMTTWASRNGKWAAPDPAHLAAEERLAAEQDGLLSPRAATSLLGDGKGPEDVRLLVLRTVTQRPEASPQDPTRQRVHVSMRAVVMDPLGKVRSSVDHETDVECVMEPGAALPCANVITSQEIPSLLQNAWSASLEEQAAPPSQQP